MNRRGFLCGTISVLAVAAILKGRTGTYVDNHRPSDPDGFVHLDNNGHTTMFQNSKPGDLIRVSNSGFNHDGLYIIDPCNTKATKVA